MKDFHVDVDSIIDSVHSAVGAAMDDLHRSTMDVTAGLGMKANGQTVEKELRVGMRPSLSLSNVHAGHISIRAGGEGVIRVRVTGHYRAGRGDEEPLAFTHDGSTVSIRPSGRHHGSPLNYQLEVPGDCAVSVRTINAEVDIEGTGAGIEVETVGGDVAVQQVAGACSITTVSGDVSVRALVGTLSLHTTSGDGHVLASRLRRFNLHSVSGDFTVETPLTLGEHYLASTTSGDLRLLISGSTGVTVQLKTFSGDVISDLPTEVIRAGRRTWQGRINGGGAYLEMTSMSGDLRIERGSAPVADATPAGPTPEVALSEASAETSGDVAAPEDKMRTILAALERGEITVEEAMARMDEDGRDER